MLTVSCREVGMDCDYVCKGETEEEIMKTAEEHAMKHHGYNTLIRSFVSTHFYTVVISTQ
jgi:predicted small metal-binding protein